MIKLFRRQKVIKIWAIAAIAIIVVLTWNFWQQLDKALLYINPLDTGSLFTQQYLNRTSNLFDLGVVDVNNDNWLDLYTTNHGDLQSLLINDRGKEFTDRLSELRLNQSPDFPSLEPSVTLPSIKASGLYIYWSNRKLVICTKDISDLSWANGKMRLPKSGKVERKDNFALVVDESESQQWQKQGEQTRLDLINYKFTAQGDGQLEIEFPGGPTTQFQLDDSLPLDRIYIGARGVHPTSHEFILYLKDRHGMAWADYNGDRRIDTFIALGGGAGRLKQYAPDTKDELLVNEGLNFKDYTAQASLIKDSCPARQVAWVDFDNDGLLDIYIMCGRGQPPNQLAPNQLFQQQKNGQFTNVAAKRGLALPGQGEFAWLDADNDGDIDLFWANKAGFWLYINQSGQFEPRTIGSNPGTNRKLTIADYDNDGDLDVFASSPQGNSLLTNTKGTYKLTTPKAVGLPTKSWTANWVDYDNDGLIDLHVFPDGLYHQLRDGKFEKTQLLKSKASRGVYPASTWFDVNNDGSRDLLIALEDNDPSWLARLWRRIFQGEISIPPADMKVWELIAYHNIGSTNHWLEIELIGRDRNPQAIGARVTVGTSQGIQFQQVGQAEGSIYSQGHYRLYFGLG
jgi:hypothetical protein